MWVDVDIVIGFELESEGRLVVEEVEVTAVPEAAEHLEGNQLASRRTLSDWLQEVK